MGYHHLLLPSRRPHARRGPVVPRPLPTPPAPRRWRRRRRRRSLGGGPCSWSASPCSRSSASVTLWRPRRSPRRWISSLIEWTWRRLRELSLKNLGLNHLSLR